MDRPTVSPPGVRALHNSTLCQPRVRRRDGWHSVRCRDRQADGRLPRLSHTQPCGKQVPQHQSDPGCPGPGGSRVSPPHPGLFLVGGGVHTGANLFILMSQPHSGVTPCSQDQRRGCGVCPHVRARACLEGGVMLLGPSCLLAVQRSPFLLPLEPLEWGLGGPPRLLPILGIGLRTMQETEIIPFSSPARPAAARTLAQNQSQGGACEGAAGAGTEPRGPERQRPGICKIQGSPCRDARPEKVQGQGEGAGYKRKNEKKNSQALPAETT